LIKATRAEFENVLLLDAGNALWSSRPLAKRSEARITVEAMNLMGYDALALGDLDLKLGVDILQQRMAEASFPFISGNLVVASTGELLAQPYVLVEIGGHTVGLIGLTWESAALAPTERGEQQYELLKAEDVLPRYVADLAGQTDIIILLSNMGHEDDKRLSSLVPGIDLIVSSRSRLLLTEGWKNDQTGTIIVEAGSLGTRIGRRHLRFDSNGVVVQHLDELLPLTSEFGGDAEIFELLDRYENEGG
jgi:2',3'-cyclic-nucleotide 2'-phosphodiesterase (5'-nucleotidase family)